MKAVYRFYAGMAPGMDPETGLGGKLLYAGEPDERGSQILRAANIAGAASLAASADGPALRHAMRQGALDFVVNSLDEALRILKNEVRKQQPVAVGISLAPAAVLAEMAARGVQPDLLAPGLPDAPELLAFAAHGARGFAPSPDPAGGSSRFHIVPIPAEWKGTAAAFDALLLDCLAPGDRVNRRWVRFAPRYLPAECRRLRSVACDAKAAENLFARVGEAVQG
jgi:hypothetical protein